MSGNGLTPAQALTEHPVRVMKTGRIVVGGER
jgi:hypothetical protein